MITSTDASTIHSYATIITIMGPAELKYRKAQSLFTHLSFFFFFFFFFFNERKKGLAGVVIVPVYLNLVIQDMGYIWAKTYHYSNL